MKKKIIIGLSVFSLFFLAGGIYIIVVFQRSTSKLDQIIMLHQVEILREHLLLSVKRVQSDLSLRKTRYERNLEVLVEDVNNMGKTADTCFDCHHSPQMTARLHDLKDHIELYKEALSRVFTTSANSARLTQAEDRAFSVGEDLGERISGIITMASANLETRTQKVMQDIAFTKKVLFTLVAVGPFLAIALAYIFITGFTGPLESLLTAIRRLKRGDLDYRIGGLRDEFGEVAESFNEMTASLKDLIATLDASEKRYRILFESAGDAIFILGTREGELGRIIDANKAAADMHGFTVTELIDMNISDLDTPASAEGIKDRISRMMRGEWIKAEIEHRRRDGSVFPVEVTGGIMEIGGRKYILAFDRDITQRKNAEEALQRTEQLRIVGELASGLAHEIKNPLAGVKVSLQVMLTELKLEEEDRNVFVKMIGEVERIESLIKALLNFARPPRPQFAPVNINKIMEQTMALTLSKKMSGAIEVVTDFDRTMPDTFADPSQLEQVFLNLILNAAEAMPEGGMLTLRTYYEPEKRLISIFFSDTGPGIDEAKKARIFEPFFSTKAYGTGLGLSITKRLIEQNGGTISIVESGKNGTTFRVMLGIRDEGGLKTA